MRCRGRTLGASTCAPQLDRNGDKLAGRAQAEPTAVQAAQLVSPSIRFRKCAGFDSNATNQDFQQKFSFAFNVDTWPGRRRIGQPRY